MKLNKKDYLRIYGIIKNKVVIGPKTVNIHLNNYCNYKCLFCWYHSPLVKSNYKRKKELDFGILKRVIDECAEMGVEEISLESEGETFLYPKIIELISYIKSKGMKVGAYTNGFFENIDIENLKDVDWLAVNLSAGTERTYRVLQAGGRANAFRKVIKNLMHICALTKRYGKPKVWIVYIITELNYKEIEKIIKICAKLCIRYVKFKLIEATTETKMLMPSKSAIEFLKNAILKIKTKKYPLSHNLDEILSIISQQDFLKNCYGIEKTDLHNDRYFYFHNTQCEQYKCYIPWFKSYIDIEGRVIAPCDNGGMFIMGNIKNESFKDIWFSKKYMEIRIRAKTELDLKDKIWQQCRYCTNTRFNKNIYELIKNIEKRRR